MTYDIHIKHLNGDEEHHLAYAFYLMKHKKVPRIEIITFYLDKTLEVLLHNIDEIEIKLREKSIMKIKGGKRIW